MKRTLVRETANLTVTMTLVWAAGCSARLDTPPAVADTVLVGGRIVTVDTAFSYAESVAIKDGRFLAVGADAEIRALVGPSTNVIELKGRTVTPGLMDNHLHNAGGGPGVDLSRARTMAEVLEAIRERASTTAPGDVVLTNADWHEAQLAEQRLPLRRDLDAAAPNHPVVMVRGGHEYILNSAALRKWAITRATPEPPGGRITRYPDGELNGELVDAAKRLVTLPPGPELSLEERMAARAAEYATLHAAGLTSVRHPGITIDDYRLLQGMRARGLLTMRVNALLRPDARGDAAAYRDVLLSSGIAMNEGDDWLRVGGVKLGVDGGFEGGLMRAPYEEPYGQHGEYFGLRTVPVDRFTAIVKELNRLGWRVSTHAVGDAAIDQVLEAYAAANAEIPIVGKRWTLEHGFLPAPEHFERLNALGVYVAAQHHLYLAGPSLVQYWGPVRAAWTTPVQAYLAAGVPVSGGTDASVVPYPPLWVFYHFVTRDTITGGVLGADQRVSREDALRLLTVNNAALTFEEGTKGAIAPGHLADLVVLSDDLMACPEERIDDITVLLTMVGGTIVFQHTAMGQ